MPQADENPPAFNIPAVVLVLALLMILIHAGRVYLLNQTQDQIVILLFSFLPITYHLEAAELYEPLSRYWSPVSHALLHGDWGHLFVNLLWMVAFGSAVARRFAALRFLVFMALASVAGALAHFAFHTYEAVPVIGASGAVSACMGAALRFAFVPGRSLHLVEEAPAQSLLQSLGNRSTLSFALIWLALNFLIGTGLLPIVEGQNIAWEAHVGGFFFGWLAFALFDRKRRHG